MLYWHYLSVYTIVVTFLFLKRGFRKIRKVPRGGETHHSEETNEKTKHFYTFFFYRILRHLLTLFANYLKEKIIKEKLEREG